MSDVYLSLTDSQNNILLSINDNATVLPLTPQPSGVSGSVSVTNVVSVNVVTMPAITVQATAASVTTIIGTVTISSMPNVNVGTVTLGPGNSQIGSVTASITGTVPVSISVMPASTVTVSSLPSLAAGTAQIGSVTASISGTVPVSGTVTANTGLTQPLTDVQLRASAVPVSGTFYPATQPVSIASLPSLAAGTNQIGSVTASISGTVPVSLNTLPASTVTVSSLPSLAAGTAQIGSVTASISGTVPVSIASLPSLAAGTNQVGSVTASLNQGGTAVGSANPLQVTLANTGANATAIKVDGSASIQPISGSVTAFGQSSSGAIYPLLVGEAYTSFQNSTGLGRVAVEPIDQNGNTLVQDAKLKTLVTNSVTIGSLPAISGTVTANVPLYEYDIQYIRCNFNITDINETNITGNVYLRKIGEYTYESIRYAGGEDEAYVKIYLERRYPNYQDMWRFFVNDNIGTMYGNLAFRFPQDGGNFGSSLPPNNGWTLEGGYSGTLSISHEQPQLNNIQGTITVGNSVTIGSLPVQLSTTTIGGTSRLNVTLSSATTVGATAPSYGNLSGGSDGTNFRAILTDTSGRTVVTGSLTVTQSGSTTIGALPSGALTTNFGSVTTANTAQITSAVTNASRKYLLAQNISSGTVTIGIGFSPTTTKGIQLTAGAGITFDSFCPTGAVYWLGATTGANFTILEG